MYFDKEEFMFALKLPFKNYRENKNLASVILIIGLPVFLLTGIAVGIKFGKRGK